MNWEDIPTQLPVDYVLYAPLAIVANDEGRDHIDHDELGPVYFKGANAAPIPTTATATTAAPLPAEPSLYAKTMQAGQPAKPFFQLMGDIQRPFGGPNPLYSTLLGGALGAGLGYGGGAIAGAIAPDKYFDKEKIKRRWALLGGAAGAALPAYFWGRPAIGQHGISGLLKSSELSEITEAAKKEFSLTIEADDMLHKMALAGAEFAPIIPVDRFNRLIMGDPYIPPHLQAATMGLTAAASAAKGGVGLVSPMDVGRIAAGMGSGLVSGMIVGKTLGAIAGLKPDAQQRLQQAGMVAGLIRNVVPLVFER